MRRYGKNSETTVVPGKDAGLALTLQPLAEACAEVVEQTPCEPAIDGLYWFSDSTGLYDQDVEAAYLLAEGAAGPALSVAKLVGEPCDLPVTWAMDWTPASGTGGDPGYLEDGASLIVYPLEDTAPGVLEVTAEHGGQSYGPILLTVIANECYYEPCADEPCVPNITGLLWTFYAQPEIDVTIGSLHFHEQASLVGDFCPGCSVAWSYQKVGASGTIITRKYNSDSKYAYMAGYLPSTAQIGYATITATVTCGGQTFGPFTVRANIVNY